METLTASAASDRSYLRPLPMKSYPNIRYKPRAMAKQADFCRVTANAYEGFAVTSCALLIAYLSELDDVSDRRNV